MPPSQHASPGGQASVALKETVLKDLKQVGYGAAVLYGIIGFLLLGSQPAAIKCLTEPGQLSEQAVEFYVDLFKQTAPLTLAIALVGILWACALRAGAGLQDVGGLFILSAFILVVSSALGNHLGAGKGVEGQRLVGDLPFGIGVCVNALYSYYRAYQGTLFFSSLLVGGYLAVVWVWKIEPLIKSLSRQSSENARP